MWVTHIRESLYLAKYPGFLSLFSIRPGSLKSSRSQTHPYKTPTHSVSNPADTHTHTTLKGEIHLFSHCALRLLSCPAKRGGRENKLLGISGLLSRQHSLQAKALQLTVKPHQPKWRAMKASCNNHVGPLSWQWLTNRMGKTQPLLSLFPSLCLLKRKRHICCYLMSLQ